MIKEAWRRLLLKSGAFFFKLRNYLFPVFILALFLFTKPALLLGRKDADIIAVIIGAMLSLAGALFRLFVIGFAYIKRGGKDGQVYADHLVAEGIYAHVRNPMYVGNFFGFLGIAVIYGSVWSYAGILFFSFVYLSIVVKEEEYLRLRFGAGYDEYCRKVNRFVPNFSGLRQTLKPFAYDWKKALRKDYGTFLGILLGCYATWLRKGYVLYGFGGSGFPAFLIFSPLLFFGLAYALVRYLKKSGRLKS